MKKVFRIFSLLVVLSSAAWAQSKVAFEPADTSASVLKRQLGQRVELHLNNGEKLVGKVEGVGEKTVHLGAITGQEFFDAVVVLEEISAVLIRNK